jgi:hypothetical protein
MAICDNCGKPAEFKVYLDQNKKSNGSAPVEIPLYVISCIECLKGYEAPGTQTIQCFTIKKKIDKKVSNQSSFL